MVGVLADEELYALIGGAPPEIEELRARYRRLVMGHSPDGSEEWQNWIVRRRTDGRPIGTLEATIVASERRADIAWIVGRSWQGQGFASEAAGALVRWLEAHGTRIITAHVHPDHHASATVASRAGLSPTSELRDGERVWRREDSTASAGSGP